MATKSQTVKMNSKAQAVKTVATVKTKETVLFSHAHAFAAHAAACKSDVGVIYQDKSGAKRKLFASIKELGTLTQGKARAGVLVVEGTAACAAWVATLDAKGIYSRGGELGSLALITSHFKGATGFYKSLAEAEKATKGKKLYKDGTTAWK